MTFLMGKLHPTNEEGEGLTFHQRLWLKGKLGISEKHLEESAGNPPSWVLSSSRPILFTQWQAHSHPPDPRAFAPAVPSPGNTLSRDSNLVFGTGWSSSSSLSASSVGLPLPRGGFLWAYLCSREKLELSRSIGISQGALTATHSGPAPGPFDQNLWIGISGRSFYNAPRAEPTGLVAGSQRSGLRSRHHWLSALCLPAQPQTSVPVSSSAPWG